MGLAGGAGSCLPASFVLGELPGHGGSTLQRDTRRSRHEHGAVGSPTFDWYQSSPGWQKQRGPGGPFPMARRSLSLAPSGGWERPAPQVCCKGKGSDVGCTQHLPSSPLRGLRWGKQAHENGGACVRDLPESLQPEHPKGMSLLRGCKDPFRPFPQGSHLAEVFFPVSCCLVPGPWLGSTGRETFTRLCG